MAVVKVEEGSLIDAGTTMYKVWLQGSENPVLVEVRSNKGMPGMTPPFGVVATHTRALSKEEKAQVIAKIAAL